MTCHCCKRPVATFDIDPLKYLGERHFLICWRPGDEECGAATQALIRAAWEKCAALADHVAGECHRKYQRLPGGTVSRVDMVGREAGAKAVAAQVRAQAPSASDASAAPRTEGARKP